MYACTCNPVKCSFLSIFFQTFRSFREKFEMTYNLSFCKFTIVCLQTYFIALQTVELITLLQYLLFNFAYLAEFPKVASQILKSFSELRSLCVSTCVFDFANLSMKFQWPFFAKFFRNQLADLQCKPGYHNFPTTRSTTRHTPSVS